MRLASREDFALADRDRTGRGWHIPGQEPGTPPVGGRKAKGGRRIDARLSAEASEALARLHERGLGTTEAIEAGLIALDERRKESAS